MTIGNFMKRTSNAPSTILQFEVIQRIAELQSAAGPGMPVRSTVIEGGGSGLEVQGLAEVGRPVIGSGQKNPVDRLFNNTFFLQPSAEAPNR